jgi:diadenosine tetraphosphate (Ap4A) HIT family hydrolase
MSEHGPCLACDIVAGRRAPPRGILWRSGGFALHALADPSPLPGWLVLTSERHARAWYDLEPGELAALGTAAAQVMAAQRSALQAEHVYAFAIGDVLHHFHLHLVPRFAATPERLRGRRCFDGLPEDMLPAEAVERAARLVADSLDRGKSLAPAGGEGQGEGGFTASCSPSLKLG